MIKNKQFYEAITSFNKIKNKLNLDKLKTIKNGYSRNILSNKNGWLMIINWDKNVITPIHGHPDLAFIYTMSGKIINTCYDKKNNLFKNSNTMMEGDCFYSIGKKNSFTNAPHKLETKEPSVSLHYYSDDGKKGQLYDTHMIPIYKNPNGKKKLFKTLDSRTKGR